MKKLMFIYSLPRSGSTLLQKLIATNRSVKTISEPWLLLPIYTMDKPGVNYSIYGSIATSNAISDLKSELVYSDLSYKDWRKKTILDLYSRFQSDVGYDYLLDKTPRYSLIVDEVSSDFEEHINIILWRNPLAIAASMISTWGNGYWNIKKYDIDFFHGLPNIIETYKKHKNRFFVIKYEDLVKNPDNCLNEFSDKYEIENPFEVGKMNEISLNGRMGDPNFGKKFSQVSTDSIDNWKSTYCNPIRRYWGRKLLDSIGRDGLEVMGYDINLLKESLSDCKGYKFIIRDSISSLIWIIATRLELKVQVGNYKYKKTFFKR